MRELEFLPDWYHRARRSKRIVVLEVWVLLIVAVGLGTWTFLARGNLRAKETMVTLRQGQLDQTHSEEKMLTEQLSLREELRDREQIIASLGFPVDMTRLLQTLDSVMPKEMSMTDFDCNIEETQKQQTTAIAAAPSQQPPTPQYDRRLKVKLVAVAPSDVDLANFLAGLTDVPFFDQVGVTYSHYKSDQGHVFREFEVTFSMDLNQSAEN
jgi:hypothetical protein